MEPTTTKADIYRDIRQYTTGTDLTITRFTKDEILSIADLLKMLHFGGKTEELRKFSQTNVSAQEYFADMSVEEILPAIIIGWEPQTTTNAQPNRRGCGSYGIGKTRTSSESTG